MITRTHLNIKMTIITNLTRFMQVWLWDRCWSTLPNQTK